MTESTADTFRDAIKSNTTQSGGPSPSGTPDKDRKLKGGADAQIEMGNPTRVPENEILENAILKKILKGDFNFLTTDSCCDLPKHNAFSNFNNKIRSINIA